MDFSSIDIQRLVFLIVSLIIAIVGHEIMHGFIAYKFGDSTAKNLGRLSINPIKHVDPLGTIVVPSLLYFSTGMAFGWAKPVPVNMSVVIRNGGYMAGVYVALAGIFYNLILAITSLFLVINFVEFLGQDIGYFLFILFSVNLFLALFNLYPIPPLDGSKALIYALAMLGYKNIATKISSLERYGMIILVVILISPISDYVFAPIRYVFKYFLAML
ncbi:site-2 protease family protein [Campylobacter majalis]|uniref:site-2 protease family protein n=1 Tax=Campylobacter majalis TaxID=2790656 RepID=UPI003D6840D7